MIKFRRYRATYKDDDGSGTLEYYSIFRNGSRGNKLDAYKEYHNRFGWFSDINIIKIITCR